MGLSGTEGTVGSDRGRTRVRPRSDPNPRSERHVHAEARVASLDDAGWRHPEILTGARIGLVDADDGPGVQRVEDVDEALDLVLLEPERLAQSHVEPVLPIEEQ